MRCRLAHDGDGAGGEGQRRRRRRDRGDVKRRDVATRDARKAAEARSARRGRRSRGSHRPTGLVKADQQPRKSQEGPEGCGGSAKACRGTGEARQKRPGSARRRKPRPPKSAKRKSPAKDAAQRPGCRFIPPAWQSPEADVARPFRADSRACRRKGADAFEIGSGRRSARSSRRCRAVFP